MTEEEKRNYRFSDKNKTPRVPTITIYWSKDSRKFADGWGHFYLFDANGTLKTQLTSGEFVCSAIEGVDEKT